MYASLSGDELRQASLFAIESVMQHRGDVIMAVAQLGRGTVFAVDDPWLYNEYVDGRKLPAEFENFKASQDLARWLIRQAAARKT